MEGHLAIAPPFNGNPRGDLAVIFVHGHVWYVHVLGLLLCRVPAQTRFWHACASGLLRPAGESPVCCTILQAPWLWCRLGGWLEYLWWAVWPS